MSGINVVLAQLTPKPRDARANLETAADIFARHAGADLFVFPELFLCGYTTDGVEELAVDTDGPEVGEVARLAGERGGGGLRGARARPRRAGRGRGF